jgi:ribosomal protein L37AE/L43A
VRLSDPRYRRDFHRYELAWRLIGFDARTRTVERWTGLSTYQIRTFYRAYAAGEPAVSGSPLRGVAPTQVRFFWRSAQLKCEAAVLAGFLRGFDVLPILPSEIAPEDLPGIARGERLCRAYTEFKSLLPETVITIEHAMLLLTELVRGVEITLGRCPTCHVLMVVDRLAIGTPRCAYCAYEAQAGLPYLPAIREAEVHSDSVEESTEDDPDDDPSPGRQGSLF